MSFFKVTYVLIAYALILNMHAQLHSSVTCLKLCMSCSQCPTCVRARACVCVCVWGGGVSNLRCSHNFVIDSKIASTDTFDFLILETF